MIQTRKIYSLIFLMLGVVTMFSCSSGKRAYERGDYDRAVFQAVNRLRSKPDHEKSRKVLLNAYNYAITIHKRNINTSLNSMNPLKWEEVIGDYQMVNRLAQEIEACPACLKVVPSPVIYDNELESAKLKASEARIDLGYDALDQKGNREKAKEAYLHFQVAKRFDPFNPDIDGLMMEAREFATLKVVVDPIPSPSRVLDIRHAFFENQINEELHRTQINEFVRFFSAEEARNMQMDYPDHIISISFEDFTLGNVIIKEKQQTVSRDSVKIKSTRGSEVYATVEAELTTYEKSLVSSGLMDFRIIDARTNKVLKADKIPGTFTWVNRWASYNGDKRALSEEQLELTQLKELPSPPPTDLFTEMTRPLYEQIIGTIKTYYRQF